MHTLCHRSSRNTGHIDVTTTRLAAQPISDKIRCRSTLLTKSFRWVNLCPHSERLFLALPAVHGLAPLAPLFGSPNFQDPKPPPPCSAGRDERHERIARDASATGYSGPGTSASFRRQFFAVRPTPVGGKRVRACTSRPSPPTRARESSDRSAYPVSVRRKLEKRHRRPVAIGQSELEARKAPPHCGSKQRRRQQRSQPKIFGGVKCFDFQRATVFRLGRRLTNSKKTRYARNLGVMTLLANHPRYVYLCTRRDDSFACSRHEHIMVLFLAYFLFVGHRAFNAAPTKRLQQA